ncbi:SIR2 family protein [Bacillus rubiinfantis]|uniref:SIR2 family protein n=1 Tax=Bacillus rubiinfantis TaxID=1499680 RepID=UPI0005A7E9AD|nr:SIR2 family protein [Bacillus rubiinfantis]
MDHQDLLLPYTEHIRDIKQALSKDDAYLFVGAGFSMNAEPRTTDVQSGFKTWTAFMEQLAKRLWPSLDGRELAQKVAGNHLYIAQLFEEEFGTSAFYKELLQAVPYKDYIPSSIHKEFIGLKGWKGFITTNQDCLIEQTLEQLHVYHDVIISDLDIATKPASTKVFKLHGSMERPESIVFTEEQYRTYEQDHPLLHVKVKSIFAEHCVVFVGFSLTDANFKAIYGWVKDVLHSDYQRKAYAFVKEDDIDPYTKRYWEKRNIILLPIFKKPHQNTGAAFQQSLTLYIDELKREEEVTKATADRSALYALFKSQEWTNEDTKELLWLLNQVTPGQDYQLVEEFTQFLEKHGSKLNHYELFSLFESIYKKQLVSPFYKIEGIALIDQIIALAERGECEAEVVYHYQLEKAECLLLLGEFEELERLVNQVLKNDSLPIEFRNSLLYLQIIVAKYGMNFERIHELLRQIVIDWEQPIWLNRLASTYLLLGERSLALNVYNRAIQVAEEKSDDWSLYLAYLSKRFLLNDLFLEDSFEAAERKVVQEAIIRLSKRLKETADPTFKRWQHFDDLKGKWWSEYKNWKEQLGSNRFGFNSLKGESIYTIYEIIHFYEINGIPHVGLSDKKFDVLLDIFVENNQRVNGTELAILFGHDKQIKHAYRFEVLTEIAEQERLMLFQQSIRYVENMIGYIRSLRDNSYFYFAQLWLPSLIQLWIQLIPILKDEEIDQVGRYSFKLFDEIQKFPVIDRFTNARDKLITVFDRCLFYRKEAIDQKKILHFLQEVIGDFRLIGAFARLDWEGFAKGSLPDGLVEGVASRLDSSYCSLLANWLEADMLTDDQKQVVFKKIYQRNAEEDEANHARFLLLQFFKTQLDTELQLEFIEYGIHEFSQSLSSRNGQELYLLAQVVEIMTDDQVKVVLESIEEKYAASSSIPSAGRLFISKELKSVELYFLFKLWSMGKLADTHYLEALSNLEQFEMNMANQVAQLAKVDQFTDVLFEKLLNSSYSHQVDIRKTGQLLIGYWLKERAALGERETQLLQRLVVGLEDSNVKIASESIRGIAFVLRDNPFLVSEHLLVRVVEVTKRGINRNEIVYLANLAFLYKELSKQEQLPDSAQEVVEEVISRLSQSSYSNVRRECRG